MTQHAHIPETHKTGPLRHETPEQAHRVISPGGGRTQGNLDVLTTPKRGAHGVRPTGQLCPECGMKSVTRQSLSVAAPVPPRGHIVVACGKCSYTATVETKRWEATVA